MLNETYSFCFIAAANGVEFRGILTGLPIVYTATLKDQTNFKFIFNKAGPGTNPPDDLGEFAYDAILKFKELIQTINFQSQVRKRFLQLWKLHSQLVSVYIP